MTSLSEVMPKFFASKSSSAVRVGAGFGDLGIQVVESRIAAADRLQVALLEVGSAGGEFQFSVRELGLKRGEARLLAGEFLLLRRQRLFGWECHGGSSGGNLA